MELVKLEMTPKERKIAYARGEEVDRIPTSLSAGETAPPLYGISIRDYYFSADAMVEVESRLAEDFQADNMGMGLGLRTLVEALGTKLEYPEHSVSYIEKPALETFDDLDHMELINVEKDGRFPIIIEAFERLQEKYGKAIYEGCYDGYGHFGIYDVYDLIVEWNKQMIPEIIERIEAGKWRCDSTESNVRNMRVKILTVSCVYWAL